MAQREPNSDLLALIDGVAAKAGIDGETRQQIYSRLESKAKMSRASLNYVMLGSEPRAKTLLQVARFGRINPLRLFQAAGWITTEDIAAMCPEVEGDGLTPGQRLRAAIEAEGLTAEDVAQVGRLLTGIVAQLAETDRLETEHAAGDGSLSPPPRTHMPEQLGSA